MTSKANNVIIKSFKNIYIGEFCGIIRVGWEVNILGGNEMSKRKMKPREKREIVKLEKKINRLCDEILTNFENNKERKFNLQYESETFWGLAML